MKGISLAYNGVHQIFQLALAAHEINELDGLMCSMVDGPGTWGHRLRHWVRESFNRPLGYDAIPIKKIVEHPWPIVADRIISKVFHRQSDYLRCNESFDRSVSNWLRRNQSRVFVGTETCALESLRQANKMGMKNVLDCPGVPSSSLNTEAARAADKFGLSIPIGANSAKITERKLMEIALADVVLCCSEYQRLQMHAEYPEIKRTEVVSLWTDVGFWATAAADRKFSPKGSPLRALYVGGISLRKGVPYLLDAVESLETEVSLTLVGRIAPEMPEVLKKFRSHYLKGHVAKQELREIFRDHDLLVMPTLGDSFGFVTAEAMASGLPVIASRNAGAPLPSEDWRVDAHSSEQISNRLQYYVQNRDLLYAHSELAYKFARQFDPASYRKKIAEMFAELLAT
jgi:glycosyltransferase involved in cell wall biosynthesis